jgi:hypothetical protein
MHCCINMQNSLQTFVSLHKKMREVKLLCYRLFPKLTLNQCHFNQSISEYRCPPLPIGGAHIGRMSIPAVVQYGSTCIFLTYPERRGPFTSPVKILQSLCLLGEGSGETSVGRYLNLLSELVSMHFLCQIVAFLPTGIEEMWMVQGFCYKYH